jgi:hypothetical protein
VPKTFGFGQLVQAGVHIAEQALVAPGPVVGLVQELVPELLRPLQRAQVGQDVLVEEGD